MRAILLILLFSAGSTQAQQVGKFDWLELATDAQTIASDGTGAAATATITPAKGVVTITCNDPDTCAVTLGESTVPAGQPITFVNIGTNAVTISTSSGVQHLQGAWTGGQYDAITMLHVGAGSSGRWVELGRSFNTAAAVSSSSTSTFTNKTLNAESTGNVVTIPFTEWWQAAGANDSGAYAVGWDYTTANFPTLARYDGSNVHAAVANFLDSETDNFYREFKLPADWTGALDVVIYWRSTATSGNVVWQIATSCSADAETDDAAFNTAQTITDAAKGTTNQLNTASLTSLTTTGCAAGELLHLKLFRDPTHGSDTLGATASFVGLEFTYRRAM